MPVTIRHLRRRCAHTIATQQEMEISLRSFPFPTVLSTIYRLRRIPDFRFRNFRFPIPNSAIPDSQFPIPQFPIPQFPIPQFPIPQFPVPDFRSTIPDSRAAIPNSQSPVPDFRISGAKRAQNLSKVKDLLKAIKWGGVNICIFSKIDIPLHPERIFHCQSLFCIY